jgi:hypothetical protein
MAVVMLSLAECAAAAPNLQDAFTISGVKAFRDHQSPHIFYYLKGEKRLFIRDKLPDFRYDVNRYIGNRQTGDTGTFSVRGVIRFQTSSEFLGTSLAEVADELAARFATNVELKAAPIAHAFNKLVYETITPVDDHENHGEIDGGLVTTVSEETEESPRQRFASQRQRFTIGLETLDANFFWENFKRENLILSLAYGWEVAGVIPDNEDGWTQSTYTVANTLPIEVSPEQYPSLFSKNELWQRVEVAHSNLMVMCYDFINLAKLNLYYVIVDIRFKTLGNRIYQESVKFMSDSHEYEQQIRFQLANDLEQGYEYRIHRLYMDGTRQGTDWQSANKPVLDVSMSIDELKVKETSTGEDT